LSDCSRNSRVATRPVGSALTQENIVPDTTHFYVAGAGAAAIMAMAGIVSGLAAFAWTGDGRLALLTASVALVLAGIALMVWLWRLTRTPIPPANPPA
jgi:hypothetical protein